MYKVKHLRIKIHNQHSLFLYVYIRLRQKDQDESNELYISRAFLCVASLVLKPMLSEDSKFEENPGNIHILTLLEN